MKIVTAAKCLDDRRDGNSFGLNSSQGNPLALGCFREGVLLRVLPLAAPLAPSPHENLRPPIPREGRHPMAHQEMVKDLAVASFVPLAEFLGELQHHRGLDLPLVFSEGAVGRRRMRVLDAGTSDGRAGGEGATLGASWLRFFGVDLLVCLDGIRKQNQILHAETSR